MPISQTRMMAVIAAGLDYQQALMRLVDHIQKEVKNVAYGSISHEGALQLIELYANEMNLLDKPRESPTTLALEHRHFATRSKINFREAERAKRRRAEYVDKSKQREQNLGNASQFIQSIKPKHKAPETLMQPNFKAARKDAILAEADAAIPLTEAEAKAKAKIEAEIEAEAQVDFAIPAETIVEHPDEAQFAGLDPVDPKKAAVDETIDRMLAEKAKRDEWLANNKHQCDSKPGQRCTMCGKMRPASPPDEAGEAKD